MNDTVKHKYFVHAVIFAQCPMREIKICVIFASPKIILSKKLLPATPAATCQSPGARSEDGNQMPAASHSTNS